MINSDVEQKKLTPNLDVPQLSPTSTIAEENYDGIRLDAILVYAVCIFESKVDSTNIYQSICFFMFALCLMVVAAALVGLIHPRVHHPDKVSSLDLWLY